MASSWMVFGLTGKLHHLRDQWAGQGGGAPPWLDRPTGLSPAAGTVDVLIPRLPEGRANTVRGSGHFLRETVGRVRCAGAGGQLMVLADSGFYARAIVAACREPNVHFSINIRQHGSLRSYARESNSTISATVLAAVERELARWEWRKHLAQRLETDLGIEAAALLWEERSLRD